MSFRDALIQAVKDAAVEKLKNRGRRALLAYRAAKQKEEVDPVPVELTGPAVGVVSLREQIQGYIRTEMSRAAQAEGRGSFEDEDDFELGPEDEAPLAEHDVRMLVPENDESLDGAPVVPSPPAKAES